MTRLYIRVPVPEDYVVRTWGPDHRTLQTTAIKFLPPVRVDLDPTSEDGFDFIARIFCEWLSFRQKRVVGAMLDQLWEKTASLEDNITRIMDIAPCQILEDCKASSCLDLTWRNEEVCHRFMHRRKAVVLHDRRRVKRINKNLIIETVTDDPKWVNELETRLLPYAEQELRNGSITGVGRVTCSIASHCNTDVLRTQAVILQGCEFPHYACTRCVRAYILSANRVPTCPIPGRAGNFKQNDLDQIVLDDPKASFKLYSLIANEEFDAILPIERFVCPHCSQEVQSRRFVEMNNVTLCKYCEKCWCPICLENASLIPCSVTVAKQLYDSGETEEEWMRMFDKYGEHFIKKAVALCNAQFELVFNTTPCPKCHVAIHKSYGCNHMICTQCGNHFCYSCGVHLDRNSYSGHFIVNGGTWPLYDENPED